MQSKQIEKLSPKTAFMEEQFREVVHTAAEKFCVAPDLIAAILADEISRIDFWDRVQDFIAGKIIQTDGRLQQFLICLWQLLSREEIGTQSFGLAQMNVNTLKELICEGYLEPPEVYHEDRLDAVLRMLEDGGFAPFLVSAQVRRTIDYWQAAGVDISQRPAICGTLYSIGLTGERGVHSHPEPNQRGLEIAGIAEQLKI